jgi:hypothetical protein
MKILKKTISFRILASISTLLIAWGIVIGAEEAWLLLMGK